MYNVNITLYIYAYCVYLKTIYQGGELMDIRNKNLPDINDEKHTYDRESFTDGLRKDGFSWNEVKDIADDWERHIDD